MEELKKRYTSALKALYRLKQDTDYLANQDFIISKYYEQFRSSAIQSFECSVDTLWKFIKEYVVKTEGLIIDAPTPRSIFRECWKLKLIDQFEFDMISELIADRNLTSHSYNESTAEDISQKLRKHYQLMKNIIDRIDTEKFNKFLCDTNERQNTNNFDL